MSRKQPSLGGRLVLSVFMAILIFSGVQMMVGTVQELMESRDSMAWPTASGKVIRSELKAHTVKSRGRTSQGLRRTFSEDSYEARIEYEFQIDGVTRTGNRRTAILGGNLADKPHVEQTLEKYPVGQAVTVSYNPADPSQCVLEPGSWGGFFVYAGLSLFLIVVPLGGLWLAWSARGSQYISGL